MYGSQTDKVLYAPYIHPQNLYDFTGEGSEKIKQQAASVCCFVLKKNLWKDTTSNTYKISAAVPNLKKWAILTQGAPLGEGEPFSEEPSLAVATGFLATNKTIVTAAHVVCNTSTGELDNNKINNYYIIFGYQMVDGTHCTTEFSAGQVYELKKAKCYSYSRKYIWADYAFLKLTQPVTGLEPLAFNWKPMLNKDTKLHLIGYPSGLPCKYAGEGVITDNSPTNYFECQINASHGHSGAPLFNSATGEVVGILCSGNPDFVTKTTDQGIRTVSNQIKNPVAFEKCQRLSPLFYMRQYIQRWSLGFKLHSTPLPATATAPGLYIKSKCLNESCTLFRQTNWLFLGMGTYRLDELVHNSSCPDCEDKKTKVKDIGISGSCYDLEGMLLKPKKIKFAEESFVAKGKLKTLNQNTSPIEWLYLNIRVSQLL